MTLNSVALKFITKLFADAQRGASENSTCLGYLTVMWEAVACPKAFDLDFEVKWLNVLMGTPISPGQQWKQ